MNEYGGKDPAWVDAIFDWRWTWLIAQIAVVGIFIVSGIIKLFNFPSAVAEQEAHGFHPGALWAALTIAVQIVAPLLVISGRFVWLGAGALGVFTALTAILAHGVWGGRRGAVYSDERLSGAYRTDRRPDHDRPRR